MFEIWNFYTLIHTHMAKHRGKDFKRKKFDMTDALTKTQRVVVCRARQYKIVCTGQTGLGETVVFFISGLTH